MFKHASVARARHGVCRSCSAAWTLEHAGAHRSKRRNPKRLIAHRIGSSCRPRTICAWAARSWQSRELAALRPLLCKISTHAVFVRTLRCVACTVNSGLPVCTVIRRRDVASSRVDLVLHCYLWRQLRPLVEDSSSGNLARRAAIVTALQAASGGGVRPVPLSSLESEPPALQHGDSNLPAACACSTGQGEQEARVFRLRRARLKQDARPCLPQRFFAAAALLTRMSCAARQSKRRPVQTHVLHD